MRTMKSALKGIAMIVIASSLLTACSNAKEGDTSNGPDNVLEPAPAPKDTNTAAPAPGDTVKAAPADTIKK